MNRLVYHKTTKGPPKTKTTSRENTKVHNPDRSECIVVRSACFMTPTFLPNSQCVCVCVGWGWGGSFLRACVHACVCMFVCVSPCPPAGGMPLCKQQVSAVGRLCDALIIVYTSTEGGYISRKRITQDNVVQFDQGDIGEPVGGYVFKLITDQEKEIRPSQVRASLSIRTTCRHECACTLVKQTSFVSLQSVLFGVRINLPAGCSGIGAR